jgi:hypothetical protein
MATAAGVIKQGSSGPVPGKGIWNASVCRPGTLDCVSTDTYGAFLIPANYIPGETLTANAGSYDPKNFVPAWNGSLGAYYAVVELNYNSPPPSSCFTGETMILMEDGSQKSIEDVRTGDVVLDQDGRRNKVLDIEKPILGNRLLYAFNEGSFFITKEHPVMTTKGWQSINPEATSEENGQLLVGKLQLGTKIVKLVKAKNLVLAGDESPVETVIDLKDEKLIKLDSKPEVWNLPLYNLILDGSHIYFANGYLVHNKGGGH